MEISKMKLLVLAGGFGTRLQSVLPDTPKALAPTGSAPFLALQLENWIGQGVGSFVFLLHHQADQIKTFLHSVEGGLLKDCEITTLVEPTPMDTGGAVAHAVRDLGLDGNFLVTNADTWLGAGIREMSVSLAPAMAVIRLDNPGRYGQVQFDNRYRVTAFTEKNTMDTPGWINAGIYQLNADMFKNWDGKRFSLERQLFPALAESGELRAVVTTHDFIDIGVPDDYNRFCRWLEDGREGKLCK
jgi:D-glycero-alpha-D-manno-heptose 1-phosphate guanylyltransferase